MSRGWWMAGIIVLTPAAIFLLFLGFTTLFEYRPAKVENALSLTREAVPLKPLPLRLKLLTWNIGYAGLDKDTDFILDGGKMSLPRSREAVESNLAAIRAYVSDSKSDFLFLQEVDRSSRRSFRTDQAMEISSDLGGRHVWFAYNYQSLFVPFPPLNPIGKVRSGLILSTLYTPNRVERYALGGDYSWPVGLFQLKRCMIAAEFDTPVPGKKLYVANLHLSAYDQGGIMRRAQLDFIRQWMMERYEKGDYVILGGDWNSLFPGVSMRQFGNYDTLEKDLYWVQFIPDGWTPKGWTWAFDKKTPSCRALDTAYRPGKTFTCAIDGFLLSPNVRLLKARAVPLGFAHSDHHPVEAELELFK